MKTILLMCSMLACLLAAYTSADAQCDSNYQGIMVLPGHRVFVTDENGQPTGDTIDRRRFVPAYNLEYQSDSSTLAVQVSEFRLNSAWILLRDWCHGKVWNWDDSGDSAFAEVSNSALSAKSITKIFPMKPGDTVSVFRMIFLIDPTADSLTSTIARFPGKGTMSIELVNAASGNRIALLDTFALSATNNEPCWFLPNAAVYRCVYINPSNTDTTWAFMRVNVGATDTSNLWMRNDHMTAVYSREYITAYSGYASEIQANSTCALGGTSCDLSVITSGLTAVTTVTANAGSYSHIRLVGLDGLIKATVNTNGQAGPFNLVASSPAPHLVVLYNSSGAVCTRQVLLQ